jgi:predicted RNase H-like HicB family nuclease
MNFPVYIRKTPDRVFGAVIPDLPGYYCIGRTLEETLAEAKKTIEGHLSLMIEDGDEMLVPEKIDRHMRKPDYREKGIWAVVSVDLDALAAGGSRIDIVLPDDLLAIIDATAREIDKTRSYIIAAAVRDFIERE